MSDTKGKTIVLFVCRCVFEGDVTRKDTQEYDSFRLSDCKFRSSVMDDGIKYYDNGLDGPTIIVLGRHGDYLGNRSIKDKEDFRVFRNWVIDRVRAIEREGALAHVYVCCHFGGGLPETIYNETCSLQKGLNGLGDNEHPSLHVCNMSANNCLPKFLYVENEVRPIGVDTIVRDIEDAIRCYAEKNAWTEKYLSCMRMMSGNKINEPQSRRCGVASLMMLLVCKHDGEGLLQIIHEKISQRPDLYAVLVSTSGESGMVDESGQVLWKPSSTLIWELRAAIGRSAELFVLKPASYEFLDAKGKTYDRFLCELEHWFSLSRAGNVTLYEVNSQSTGSTVRNLYWDACVGMSRKTGVRKISLSDGCIMKDYAKMRYGEVMKEMRHGD